MRGLIFISTKLKIYLNLLKYDPNNQIAISLLHICVCWWHNLLLESIFMFHVSDCMVNRIYYGERFCFDISRHFCHLYFLWWWGSSIFYIKVISYKSANLCKEAVSKEKIVKVYLVIQSVLSLFLPCGTEVDCFVNPVQQCKAMCLVC